MNHVRPIRPPVQPVIMLPEISRNLWNKFLIYNPLLRANDVRAYNNSTILNEAKAKMASVGVTDISQFGNLQLPRSFNITKGGLIANRNFIEGKGLPLVHGAALPSSMLMANISSWIQDESVIIAEELDFSNKTIIIDRDAITCLCVIARKIKAHTNARITYRSLVNPNEGNRGKDGRKGTSYDRYNSHHNWNYAPNGGDGTNGANGRLGPNGIDAPDIKIYVLEMQGMPDIILPGQKSGKGGRGGKGGNGGNGERGRNSKKRIDCKNGPGWGGDGGDGGDGGKGGKGGRGGRGANVLVATLEENIDSTVTSGAFEIDISGGAGGDHGVAGRRGEKGFGGLNGRNTAGWPCSNEPHRDGKNGQPGRQTGHLDDGENGAIGSLEFATITKEDWMLKLESPWILNLIPYSGYPGEKVTINGENLVEGSKVHYIQSEPSRREWKIRTTQVPGDRLKFNIPTSTLHGEHLVKVAAPDGGISNEVPFHVKPYIDKIEVDGSVVTAVAAGDTLKIRGKAFSPDCSIRYRGQWHTPDEVKDDESIITFTIESIEGDYYGGRTIIYVRNEDGITSNTIRIDFLPVADSGFRAGVNGYAFDNFSKGKPSWNIFRSTFEDPEELIGEVDKAMFTNPVLTLAFYNFLFKPYLNGGLGGAYCSALSETALRKFHYGVENLFSRYRNTDADPPPIPSSLMRELVIAQGRMLSEELLLHYYEQGEEGVDQIGKTIESIVTDIRDGRGVTTARTVSFIPAGTIWGSDFYENLKSSHTVVPMWLRYPNRSKSLDGAKLYIYDPNHRGKDNRFIEFHEKNGKIHFEYSTYRSEDGFTLGNATLNLSLLQDVDMPFSLGFIVDILTCPAWLRIEDSARKFVGYKNGKIHNDAEIGFVSPFVENYILTKADCGKSLRRVIEGKGTGKYNFSSFHPDRKSITIEDVNVNERTKDIVEIDQDFSKFEITSSDTEKEIKLHLGESQDERIKIASVTLTMKQDEKIALEVKPEMAAVIFKTPSRAMHVNLELRTIAETKIDSTTQRISLQPGENIELSIGDWKKLRETLKTNKISGR